MNKRKIVCDIPGTMPNPKQIKLAHNSIDLLDGIEFMDFDDEFTSSEGTSDGQIPTNSQDFATIQDSVTDAQNNVLDLGTWKRCVIDNCQRDTRTNDLIIFGHEDEIKCDIAQNDAVKDKRMECRLQHFWSQCRIEIGCVVSIMAVWSAKFKSYCVTNTDGLVVVRPDFLISGTTVVGGLFCMRKAVLQDRFKGIEAGVKIVSVFNNANVHFAL